MQNDERPDTGGRLHAVAVPDTAAGERLDKVLAANIEGLSRSRAQALLEQGHVRLDGRTIADPSQRVKPGQTFDVFLPEAEPAIPEAQDIPLQVVYEDEDVLVLDKPAGLVAAVQRCGAEMVRDLSGARAGRRHHPRL